MAKKIIDTTIHAYYDTKLKAWITTKDEQVLADSKEYAKGLVDAAEDKVEEVASDVGNLENLNTTSKESLVDAINEVRNSVSAGGTAAAISIDTSSTTEGALKSYTIKQGDNTIGTIDIPKDMVIESGTVVDLADGEIDGYAAGKYIKLVLANVTEPLYINVGTLVDIYTAEENATQIQLAIDSSTRKISATIVAGGVGTDELADGAVTTVKIADGNVTLAKLSTTVQSSLEKADSAVQSITTGGANGTITVDGEEVAVKGLGSAAFTDSSAYDAAGSADEVQDKLDEEIARAKEAEAQVLADAKTYAEQQAAAVDISGIKTNADAISALTDRVATEEGKSADFETRIAALEDAEWATEEDIDKLSW